jgi:chorismate mutase
LIDELREQITAVDRALLAAVNRRLEIVRRLPLRDADREELLVRELQETNPGPLSSNGVAELFRYVLELTRKELHGA